MLRMGVRQISIADLCAIIMISGWLEASRRAFLQTETTLALAQSADVEGEELGETEGDDRTVSTTRGKRSLLSKALRFVAKQEAEEKLVAKLSNTGKPVVKPGEQQGSKDALKKIREAQLAFTAAVCAVDSQACYDFARTGACARGDQCRFNHTLSAGRTDKAEKAGGKGHCIEYRNTGRCRFGNRCRFEHTRQVAGATSGGGATTGAAGGTSTATGAAGKQSSQVLFTAAPRFEELSDGDEVDVVIVQARAEVACAMADRKAQVAKETGGKQYLGWDSMCSLHVANDLRLIPDAVRLRQAKEAVGLGGARPITHTGYSDVFGRKMSYIEGGGTPNLLSVGQECQKDRTGLTGMALFSAHGAVRFRVTDQMAKEIAELVDRAEAEGLVQGTAVLQNNVYREAFGADGPVEPEDVCPVESAYAVSHGMFASRIRLDSVNNVLDFMVASGMSEEALLEGVKSQSLRGIPVAVTADQVKQYFKHVGKSVEQLEAEIAKVPLRKPVDYELERATAPGATMQIDNVDPSFSRMSAPAELVAVEGATSAADVGHKKVVPSVGGYKDAVIAIDEASSYAHLVGRVSKKDPHKVLAQFVGKWQGRWGNLISIKGDKEFLTHESVGLLNAYDVRYRQAVPGDHRRTSSKIEGSIRWILELAQGNMNRLRKYVQDKIITERQARSLWFHALRQAVFAFNFRPALCDPTKTRYEMGTGDVANLSNVVLMPFGMRVMGKNLIASADGRGSECLYIGPSSTVRGGILTYSIATERVSVKYAFLPIPDVRRPAEAQVRKASKEVYGRLVDIPEAQPPPVSKSTVPGWEEVAGYGAPAERAIESSGDGVEALVSAEGATEEQPTTIMPEEHVVVPETVVVPEDVVLPEEVVAPERVAAPELGHGRGDALPDSGVSVKSGGGVRKAGARAPVVSDYNTRRRTERVLVVSADMGAGLEAEDGAEAAAPGRPPKPKVPPNKVCDIDPRWQAAEDREAVKLVEEHTFKPLPVDESGKTVRPRDAIVLRLLKIREYKWKADPDTGVERWLECVRLVCDGSVDKRPDKFYAETPDRTLLLLMTSIEGSLGIKATGSDVTRAYLNAESIDRNIVITAPKGLKGIPRESLLNKGLYGSKGGALSWQIWIDGKLIDLNYEKLQVCRGVYLKTLENGEVVRSYRHSDDFRMSSTCDVARAKEEMSLREVVRMAEFTTLTRFLGCTFERVDAVSGQLASDGKIVLVRQKEKICEMEERFKELHHKYNQGNRERRTATPVDALKEDDDLDEAARALLTPEQHLMYQSVVGCVQWVVGCTRPECKMAAFLLSIRMAKPREWDMFLAVYVMDYLVATRDAPLVLGGPEMDPVVYADASFAILPERRSVMGHVAFAGPGSGAIYAHVGSTKAAVTSIWEAELMAGCAGMDTALYLSKACEELKYAVPKGRVVHVDNKAELDWVNGSVSNKRSRHIDVRYYRSRHLQESGEVKMVYVPTEDNVADILTKPMPVKLFQKFARIILGHGLVAGKGIAGIMEEIKEKEEQLAVRSERN